MSSITIRIRSKIGMWRISNLSLKTTIQEIQEWIEKEHSIPSSQQVLALDPKGIQILESKQTLKSLELKHGDILHLFYDGDIAIAKNTGRKINADGSIILQSHEEHHGSKGFRPGLKSLRDMKMHWTVGEFMEMNAQFEFKLKRQKEPYTKQLSIDASSCNDFQSYLRQFAFQQSRCGWLYGTIDSNNHISVECIYEPPQEGDPYGFEVHDDPYGEKADQIANFLGLSKVGWVFSHPPRDEDGFLFSSREILLAAQLQMDAGGKGTPFVTLKVTLDEENHASFEAFQVSDQCMEMFSSGALLENLENPTSCLIHETFTAIVEAKEVKEVDNNFFLTVVPVIQHESYLRTQFPKLNREGNAQTRTELSAYLKKFQHLNSIERLSDFQLLLFLADYLDLQTDLSVICQSIRNKETTLNQGYQMIIESIAGMNTYS